MTRRNQHSCNAATWISYKRGLISSFIRLVCSTCRPFFSFSCTSIMLLSETRLGCFLDVLRVWHCRWACTARVQWEGLILSREKYGDEFGGRSICSSRISARSSADLRLLTSLKLPSCSPTRVF